MESLEQETQTKLAITLPYTGMKMGKNGMMCFLSGGMIRYDTFTKKHTKCKHLHQSNAVFMESLEQENPNMVGTYTTIHGDENDEEWHDMLLTGGMI